MSKYDHLDDNEKKEQMEFALQFGDGCLYEGNFIEAIEHYNNAEELGGNFPRIFVNRAICYKNIGDMHSAIKSYKKADYDALACFNLGLLYDEMENYSDAIQYLTKAIEKNNHGIVDMSKIYYQRASAKSYHASSLLPRSPTSKLALTEALNDIDTAISMSKNQSADYYYLKGHILKDGLNIDTAIISWKKGAALGDFECQKLVDQYS